ncbi:CoA transferase [Bradyrhizobium sp. CB2312]|uniref:CoA transferase subunit A n=1 Tax=Bradyrhizobium sp. CB2312 TaxID=3039155 RepID=UPI0024B1A926|nr:CoA transferase [Bradyrhizobium sp. CB2312]WFU73332.1 CoA-transferase [Bradyrhizobium sp. CB2312]
MTEIVALEALVARITSGQSLAIPVDSSGVAMAATAALLETGIRDVRLICVPISGMQADLLIGAGAIASLETSAVSLGEAGGAPRFTAGVKSGTFALRDSTCPAIFAGLLAAQKGVPFMPIAGIIGSDLLNVRPDWQVIDSPVGEARKVVVVPAISPDIALFHAPEADRAGNIRIGRHRELGDLAYAAKRTLVTVERIVDRNLLETEDSAAGVLPSLYVDAIAIAARGAWPLALWDEYPADEAEIARYAAMARSEEGFRAYLSGFLSHRKQVA